MKKFLLLALLTIGSAFSAQAQQVQIVSSCGGQSLTAATFGFLTMDITGKLCDGGGGASVTQGTIPWIIDTTTSGNLYNAVTAPIPAGDTANGGATGNIGAVAQFGSPWGVNVNYGGTALVADPCQANTPTYTPISFSASGTTRILAGTAGKKVYVCSIHVVTAAGNNVALVEGASSCGTPVGVAGGNTAATGWNITGNGISLGSGGYAVLAEATAGDDLCLITSVGQQVSGAIKTVVQ